MEDARRPVDVGPGAVEGVGVEDLRIPDGADAGHWAEMSREYVRLSGMRPPPGTRDVRGCFLPEEARPLVTEDGAANPPALVLTGMHRSATSLFARFLMASGIELGESLIGPLPSNPYGHFEDLRIVELHERALARAGGAAGAGPLRFDAAAREEAINFLRERRSLGAAWGWKDPRTCFFLDEWAELAPEATFVLLFREPLQVVDSMCRRKEQDPNTRAANSGALGAWIGHNRALLRFHRSHPRRSLLINVDRALAAPEPFMQVLRQRTTLPFESELFQRCYNPELLTRKNPTNRPVSWRLRIQANFLYRTLLRCSAV